jgi:hypothetical protein
MFVVCWLLSVGWWQGLGWFWIAFAEGMSASCVGEKADVVQICGGVFVLVWLCDYWAR